MVKYGLNRVQLPLWLLQSLFNGFSWYVLSWSIHRKKCSEFSEQLADDLQKELWNVLSDHVPSQFSSTSLGQPWFNTKTKRTVSRKKRAYKRVRHTMHTGKERDWTLVNRLKKETKNVCWQALGGCLQFFICLFVYLQSGPKVLDHSGVFIRDFSRSPLSMLIHLCWHRDATIEHNIETRGGKGEFYFETIFRVWDYNSISQWTKTSF